MTLEPGVYSWATGLLIPTDATLSSRDSDVWVLQIAGAVTVASGVQVLLSDGAQPQNVFWQASGPAVRTSADRGWNPSRRHSRPWRRPVRLGVRMEKLPAIIDPPQKGVRARRWRLARDLVSFQVKLFVDGLKDLVLAPVSLVAGLYGIFVDRKAPGRTFYQVLEAGRRFDHWVDLFGATQQRALPPAGDSGSSDPPAHAGLDGVVGQLEAVLREQYAKGGLTAKAKNAIDNALDRLQDDRE